MLWAVLAVAIVSWQEAHNSWEDTGSSPFYHGTSRGATSSFPAKAKRGAFISRCLDLFPCRNS